MSNKLIELRNLSKEYMSPAGSFTVIKQLNLTVFEGEFVALMGPSGSGKTTLMNICGCFDTPTTGTYWFDGGDVSKLEYDQQAQLRNHMIGFVFQGFNLLPRMTLIDNVALPLIYARMPKKLRQDRAAQLLIKVGLAKRMHARPSEISGGEQQRVAIARALANKPKLILADEPTGNLDSANSDAIMQIFSELNREGITILLVTHELDIAAYAKRVINLRDGNIISDQVSGSGET